MPDINDIPKIINLVWLGSVPDEELLENAENWKKNNPNYDVRIWIDSSLYQFPDDIKKEKEISKQVKKIDKWAKKNNITIVDISPEEYRSKSVRKCKNILHNEEVFQLLKESTLFNFYNDEVTGDNKNYAAASDILRVAILFLYGGFYFDAKDVFPGDKPIDEALEELNEQELDFLYHSIGNAFNNDAIASIIGGGTISRYLDNIIKQYWELYNDPDKLAAHRNSLLTSPGMDDSRKESTIRISGPSSMMFSLTQLAKEMPSSVFNVPEQQMVSWLDKNLDKNPEKVYTMMQNYVCQSFIYEIDEAIQKVDEDCETLKKAPGFFYNSDNILLRKMENLKNDLESIKNILQVYSINMPMHEICKICIKETKDINRIKIDKLFNNLLTRMQNCSKSLKQLPGSLYSETEVLLSKKLDGQKSEEFLTESSDTESLDNEYIVELQSEKLNNQGTQTISTEQVAKVLRSDKLLDAGVLQGFVDLVFNTQDQKPNYEKLNTGTLIDLWYGKKPLNIKPN